MTPAAPIAIFPPMMKPFLLSALSVILLSSVAARAECTVHLRASGPVGESERASQALHDALTADRYTAVPNDAAATFDVVVESEMQRDGAAIFVKMYRRSTGKLVYNLIYGRGKEFSFIQVSDKPRAWARRIRQAILDTKRGLPECGKTIRYIGPNNELIREIQFF